MNYTILTSVVGAAALMLGLSGCGGMSSTSSSTASSLYQQLGGKDGMTKLADQVVTSSIKDSRVSSLFGTTTSATATPKVADQMCAELGGGCKAPYSDAQLAAANERLSPSQRLALSENFSSSLNSLTGNPAVRDAVSKTLGSKMSGILASAL